MKRIIGIDPGYDRCGIAVLEKDSHGKVILLFSTCLTTKKTMPFGERLLSIKGDLLNIIDTHKPEEAAIEKLFFAKNTQTALSVAESVGVIRTTLYETNLPPVEYKPAEIKIAVTGYGNADKESVTFMVKKLLTLPNEKKLDDEMDAMAVALTHAFTSTFQDLQ